MSEAGRAAKVVRPGRAMGRHRLVLALVSAAAIGLGALGLTAHDARSGQAADPVAGKAVFARAGCGSCHVLAAAGARGTIGPNLDQRKPSYATVVERVTGGAGIMPAFKGKLSTAEIENVAAFVVEATGGQAPGTGSPGAGSAPPAGALSASRVRVRLGEWLLTASVRTVRAGKVAFLLANVGTRSHRVRLTAPGASRTASPWLIVRPSKVARRMLLVRPGTVVVELQRPGAGADPLVAIRVLPRSSRTAAPGPPAKPPSAPPADGKGLFQALCGGCHTLANAGTTGAVGPNLDHEQPDCDKVLDALREGEDGMPSFALSLTADQMDRVASYVAGSTGGKPCGGGED